eukprot:TRINITY_DN3705_c0_g1_i1.p1 TRINITY_DN3705_c0_g1~~TRINITY_DN3705_c0_g1_i1.p1  ORF type:complete len:636 (+),score=121.08 TRINITY_DN3705_c0_g1_i1:92-1999(+)
MKRITTGSVWGVSFCKIALVFAVIQSWGLHPTASEIVKSARQSVNPVTVEGYFDGAYPCEIEKCPTGVISVSSYACSFGKGNWSDGIFAFPDPIPAGNQLKSLTFTMIGQFSCDPGAGDTTLLASLNDQIVKWATLKNQVQGCNCTNCFYEITIDSDEQFNNYNEYQYDQTNIFQIQTIDNEICLSTISISIYFTSVQVNLISISPDSGPLQGSTVVNLTGDGFNVTNRATWVCKFGDIQVDGQLLDNDTLQCVSPAVPHAGIVLVEVSSNGGETYSVSGMNFSYVGPVLPIKPTSITFYLTKHWWLILAIGVLVLLVISGFILTYKSKRKKMENANNIGVNAPLLQNPQESFSLYGTIREDIDFREIQIAEQIGRGNFGEVYVATWRSTVVAVKKMKFPSVSTAAERESFLADFEKEAAIMRSIRHPNVLQFLGICSVKSEICIITEFMPKGSLHRILHDPHAVLDWEIKLKVSIDVCRGMNYLHKCEPIIIHRDLKSHNLLVDENFKVKVSDFGLATLVTTQSSGSMTACGTPAYTAPEVLRNERYDTSADVFSFGVVLWELVTRKEPHKGIPPFQVVYLVGTQGKRLTIPSTCPPSITQIIQECWRDEPSERPTFEELTAALEDLLRSGESP